MLYRTEDLARWGAGKGSNLAPLEVDENWWEVEGRLQTVEAAALEAANGIANVTVTGSQMTVYLEDGTPLGPFTLPTAMIRYRGDWTVSTAYSELDLVAVEEVGLYLVLEDHTSDASSFDALAEDSEGNPLYRYLLPIGEPSVSAAGTVVHASPTDLNFAGAGVAVADDGNATVTITIAGASAISEEGVQVLATPANVNFAGAGVSVADDGDGTVTVTIPGIGSAALGDLSDVTIATPASGQFLRYDGSAFVNAAVGWSDLANVPASFTPSVHGHDWSEISGKPTTFTPSTHTHTADEVDGAAIEEIAGTTYTQVAADHKKWKRTTNGSAVTITIDASINAAGDEITFEQAGAGTITFAAGAGMTLNSRGAALESAGQYAVCGVKFVSPTEATFFGDITT